MAFFLLAGLFFVAQYKSTPASLSCTYNPPRLSTQDNLAKLTSFVDKAAEYAKTQGEKSYTDFRIQGSNWWSSDSYVFVYDLNGKTLVLPPQQNIEGTNRINIKDDNGTYYIREMVNWLKTHNSGWVQYVYPKPGATVSSPKLSYFKKVIVGGKTVIIGSGVYIK